MPACAMVSFRLGGSDGVSIVAAGWQRALRALGLDVYTVAGSGPVDRLLPGLALAATEPPSDDELRAALDDADLVVVENLCTIPLNLPAARAAGRVLAGRPAVMHHHDPPWQLPQHAHVTELPLSDPAWRHVVINEATRHEFASRRIDAMRIYNGFDTAPPVGDRELTRAALGIADDECLLMHPVRAIPRKNIPGALRLAEALDATYWLVGPAEDGYEPELERLLRGARCRVVHDRSPGTMHDAYAASDAVAFPSLREGFGNPPIEAAFHLRPVAVGHYPVAAELRAYGFRWFDPDDPRTLASFVQQANHEHDELLEHNRRIAIEHFSHERMARDIAHLLDEAGWLP
jgi:glycosyltransferase involved in cell wall biosynthesis